MVFRGQNGIESQFHFAVKSLFFNSSLRRRNRLQRREQRGLVGQVSNVKRIVCWNCVGYGK